jgi:Domain of unknown function (DUF4833)
MLSSTAKLSRRRAVAALGCLALMGVAAEVRAVPRRFRLFHIARSKNENVVVYDLMLKGGLPRTDPVDVYWLLRAEDGRREELSFLERQLAYGYEVVGGIDSRGFEIKLVAVDRILRVRVANERAWAETVIGQHWSRLERVYVKASGAALWPRVDYVELQGRTLAGDKPVRERIRA